MSTAPKKWQEDPGFIDLLIRKDYGVRDANGKFKPHLSEGTCFFMWEVWRDQQHCDCGKPLTTGICSGNCDNDD